MADSDEEIAVVGIGCNFPGGEGLCNFWKILSEGKNCTVQIPDGRFETASWYNSDGSNAGKTQTAKAALIDGLNEFDHKFFGIMEAEADFMDPQQKLLLECTYRALENAGIPMEKASGTRTGVFIGLMNRDYETLLNNSPTTITHYNGTGTAMSIAANRISYTFNFTGPSLAIDSACSSSLVALHYAAHAVRQGDCEMAVCGGVSCILEPRVFVALSKAKMISPDGSSKPFSSRADGYGRGEGCGIVLLKPLKKAQQDFDHVWGIISKTAVNQDGHSVTPITRPSMAQQEELLHRIYSAGFDPSHIQYIEAHGTGTPVGDPTEASSISRAVAKARPPGEALCIGSVKGNIGHTESAAGVAGLIKVLLMMHHETMVPTLFYSEDSASINAKALNLKILTSTEKWEKAGPAGRAAGINNFGFGGTNAHAIVREYREISKSRSTIQDSTKLFVLSAASEKSIRMTIADIHQELTTRNAVDLKSLAYTSACRRSHLKHKYRKVFLTSSLSNLQEQLSSALTKRIVQLKLGLKSVFVFCGNGLIYRGMCKELLKEEPIFREKIKEVKNLFQKYTNTNILQKLENDYDNADSNPDVVQPLLFAIQVAICSLLKHWGIRPDAVLGHSVGEVAAAHCSGLLSLKDAVKVIYFRSMLQSKVTGGKMLVVSNIAVSEILRLLSAYSGKVCLAAFNSPQSCTLSGNTDAVECLHNELKTSFNNNNVFLHILDVPAAYHSHMMDPILDQIQSSIGSLRENEMEAELFSTVTGQVCSQGDFSSGKYWARNVREPVAFEQALRSAAKDKKNIVFVEIGPRRALQRNIMETLGNDITVFPSVQPDKDHETLFTTVSKLFELGVNVNWEQFYNGQEAPPTPFPRYQFDCVKKEVYFEAVRQGNETTSSAIHPVIRPTKQSNKEFTCNLSSDTTKYLSEHQNNGVALVPGALYVELALASFMASMKSNMPLSSLQLCISFLSPFLLSQNSPQMKVQLEPSEKSVQFEIHSQSATYASGAIDWKNESVALEEKNISLDVVFSRCQSLIRGEQAYTALSEAGFQYGSVFRQLGDVFYGEKFKEAISTFRVPDEMMRELQDYYVHPVVLDHFLQMTAVVAGNRFASRPGFPSSIGCVTVSGPLQNEMVMYLRTTKETSDGFEVCGCFTDKEGHVLVELRQVSITFLGGSSSFAKEFFFHNEQHATSEDTSLSHKPKALVFADRLGVSELLQHYLHSSSVLLEKECGKLSISKVTELFTEGCARDGERNFTEVLFMCGIQDLSHLNTEMLLDPLVDCCELFREMVFSLKAAKYTDTIRIITYRSADWTVDHISPGFVISGMTRACAAEMSDFSFQLIDLGSVTSEDIRSLAHVLCAYPATKYPELTISKGQIYSSAITRTPIKTSESPEREISYSESEHLILQTADSYRMINLSATPCTGPGNPIQEQNVEVQLRRICAHSSDYFPVSVSALMFGQTMYWNKHTSQNHKLLALDFSGTITAVGRDVSKLKVGDHVVSCYPITTSSRVVIPEAACYRTKKLPFLKELPCVSFFILAWEIFHCVLPKVRQHNKLGIISVEPDSNLMKVLMFTANQSGWNAIAGTQFSGLLQNVNKCDALVLLPPFDLSLVAKACRVSALRNIVLVHDNLMPPIPLQNVLSSDSENVCVQSIQVANLFQKAYLKKQQKLIYSWLKSMRLSHIPVLKNNILQTMTSGSTECQSVQESKSYFSSDTTSVVVLHGKTKDEVSNLPIQEKPKQTFQQKSVYIVTGGLSGLGFETVKFIAQRGGECIAILSRRTSSHLQHEISDLQNRYGVSIISIQCDVSVSEQVVNAVTVIEHRFPSCPIRGVFHSAVVLHDGLLEILEKSHFVKVFRPKVNGAMNLHHATKHCKLDYFVCYSSISSFLGNATQTNYAAANSFLDMFCHYRRRLGLAAQSINWGALNLGLLLNKESLQRFLETKGMVVMKAAEFHEGLEQCLLQNNAQQVVCKFSFKNLRKHILSQNTSLKIRLSALVDEELRNQSRDQTESRVQLSTSPSSPGEYVRTMISETCNVDLQELNDGTVLSALGVDSMVSMTLQNSIFQETGVNVPLVKLLDPSSTLSTLVSILEESKNWQLQKNDKLKWSLPENRTYEFTQF